MNNILAPLFATVFTPLEEFARGGGGGSGGGGGGGGGGFSGGSYVSGSGSDDPAILATFLVIGLAIFPAYWFGAILRKRGVTGESRGIYRAVGWGSAIAYSFLGLIGGVGWFILFAIFALLGMAGGLFIKLETLGLGRQSSEIEQELEAAAAKDKVWDEASIIAHASDIFTRYQADWTKRDYQAMQAYTTPSFFQRSHLMVAALLQARRLDNVANPTISSVVVTGLNDQDGTESDMVQVAFTAQADDQLFDDRTNTLLFRDTSSFTEYWSFQRHGDTWLLDHIDEATADESQRNPDIEKLASSNGYFYSLDQGWLLLPATGRLFGEAKFGTSDVNNHVIGLYANTYLLQLYTYNPNPAANSIKNYLIAQTNVPKSYGDIVVRHRSGLVNLPIRGLDKISMEWGDFNKKYDVFASTAEGPTSFELLHPVFMEKLEALPFTVNIEVVDNVVYLYAPDQGGVSVAHYQIMLELLKEAYKQMKI